MEDDSRGLWAVVAQQPTGQHRVDSRGPCRWAAGQQRTGSLGGGHICVDAASRVRLMLQEVICRERGQLGTGATAAPRGRRESTWDGCVSHTHTHAGKRERKG